MRDIPGFFSFRWQPRNAIDGYQDIAVVFKVPGRTDLSSIPDLVEQVCRGPFVPDAVVLVHLKEDIDFAEAFQEGATANSLVRFNGRLPLLRIEIPINGGQNSVVQVRPEKTSLARSLRSGLLGGIDEWIEVGLKSVFLPSKIILKAPAGYAYQKPSQQKASYFIRAEQGLETSGSVAFVAFAAWRYLMKINGRVPQDLANVFVDTMGIATVAYALRELFLIAKVGTPPQIESFHSYGGLENVKPISGNALCLISASTSMNLHREWIQKKRVLNRDVLTLVTFEDAKDSSLALYRLPKELRPIGEELSATYDIKIKGENFVPLAEVPRSVLLKKPFHGDEKTVRIFYELAGTKVFRLFKSHSVSNAKRRGIYCDGKALLDAEKFQDFLDVSLTQHLRASTRYVVHQDDDASLELAKRIVLFAKKLAKLDLALISVTAAAKSIREPEAGLIAVAAVAGGGAAMLSLSRLLRGIQKGPRTFFIGLQITDSREHINTFDKNIKQSAHGAAIEIIRYGEVAIGSSIEDSFQLELTKIFSEHGKDTPAALLSRAKDLRSGDRGFPSSALMPVGVNLDGVLELRKDFAFWPHISYAAGAYHPEVLGTIAALLQRAREFNGLPAQHRLHSGSLQQVTLDPENFSRFDDGIIQAALLRAAHPSELDYRGDKNASAHMKDFLTRLARYLGQDRSEAALEFLSSLATGRLRLESEDIDTVKAEFLKALNDNFAKCELEKAIRFMLSCINDQVLKKKSIPF